MEITKSHVSMITRLADACEESIKTGQPGIGGGDRPAGLADQSRCGAADL